MRTHLKPPGQVQLHDMVILDRVDARNIQIIAAGAKVVLDPVGITKAQGANDVVGEAVSKCRIKAL